MIVLICFFDDSEMYSATSSRKSGIYDKKKPHGDLCISHTAPYLFLFLLYRGILETILDLCLILCCLLFHANSLNQDHTYYHNQTNHVCHSSRDQQCNTANHNQDSH